MDSSDADFFRSTAIKLSTRVFVKMVDTLQEKFILPTSLAKSETVEIELK